MLTVNHEQDFSPICGKSHVFVAKALGSIFTNPHSKNCFLCAAASALSGLVRDYRHSLGSPLPPCKLTNHRLVLRSRDLSGPITDQYSGHVINLDQSQVSLQVT